MFYTFARALLRVLYRFLFRLEAKRKDYVPKEGGVVLCSNHISLLDPPAIGIMLDRKVRFMAKAELFDVPVLGKIINGLGAFPVKRGGVGKETIRTAFNLLRDGDIMGIFPEGTRKYRWCCRSEERCSDDCLEERGCRCSCCRNWGI